jgi:hypothetical protein
MAKASKPGHYIPNGKAAVCLGFRWGGAVAREQWS